MNVLQCNGYHIPIDAIFSANVRPTECTLVLETAAGQFTLPLPEAEVRPVLEKAGFAAFDNGILINPKNVSYLLQSETGVVVYGHFGRTIHLYGQENTARVMEILYPKKKVK